MKSNLPVDWDLTVFFKNGNDPEIKKSREKVIAANYKFIRNWEKRTDYLIEPKILRKALDELEELGRLYGIDGPEGYYFGLRSYLDQNDSELKARINKIIEFEQKISNDSQFFTIKLAKVSIKQQKLFLKSSELKPYRYFLKRLFEEAQYILSEPEEKLMTLKSKASFGDWVQMTSSFLAKETAMLTNGKGKKKEQSFSEIVALINNKKKPIRDAAARAINTIFAKHIDVGEAEINAILGSHKINDELRGFSRADSSRHLSDDIETEVVDSLIKVVSKHFDIGARYYKLKANLMGVKTLEYHERNVDYGDVEKVFTYQESVDLVSRVFKKLDPEFDTIFKDLVENGRVDVYPKKGKMNGAFCVQNILSHPTFVLLNHSDQLNDVLTLAHEFGHAINYELMKQKQNSFYFGTSLATAEVASTFMEDFVLEEILKNASDEERLSIYVMKLNEEVSTIIRQVAFYCFEENLHAAYREKGYLSHKEIGSLFQKNMIPYMGDTVEQSSGSENWWLYVSHFRRFFYVYSYASGLLISKALQHKVKQNKKQILIVKEFLSAGLSDSPKNIFKKAGVDITKSSFWEEGLAETEDLLQRTETLAKKLGKI